MSKTRLKIGYTLVEMLVVMAIIALLFAIGVPAAKKIVSSIDNGPNIRGVIGSTLANARAIAMSRGTYAGVRFQADANGRFYMILIIADGDATGYVNGFVAVENRKPIRLPEEVGVMDLRARDNYIDASDTKDHPIPVIIPNTNPVQYNLPASDANINNQYGDERKLRDTNTFSIVFSKEGKLVTQRVRVWNRHGSRTDSSTDDIFNTKNNLAQVNFDRGMFLQDSYPADGLGEELSRNSFVIYSIKDLAKVDSRIRFSEYIRYLKPHFVNPYSGSISVLE